VGEIEQYLRPAIGALFHVKQPSVRLNLAGVVPLPHVPVTLTGLVGKTVYAPGSVTDPIAVTLPPAIVAVNFAGVPVPPVTVNVHVPFV
jgi:hypothetical protein